MHIIVCMRIHVCVRACVCIYEHCTSNDTALLKFRTLVHNQAEDLNQSRDVKRRGLRSKGP